MELKPKALKHAIDAALRAVKHGPWTSETFAIHEAEGVQVQIVVTKDQDEMCDNVLPEYAEADA